MVQSVIMKFSTLCVVPLSVQISERRPWLACPERSAPSSL